MKTAIYLCPSEKIKSSLPGWRELEESTKEKKGGPRLEWRGRKDDERPGGDGELEVSAMRCFLGVPSCEKCRIQVSPVPGRDEVCPPDFWNFLL
ncbi:hypothetical protein TNCV_2466211 [Trichonephila clavipes]|nr:hypothetical protein TNCV_2466211 [Trichonephila clavipes]